MSPERCTFLHVYSGRTYQIKHNSNRTWRKFTRHPYSSSFPVKEISMWSNNCIKIEYNMILKGLHSFESPRRLPYVFFLCFINKHHSSQYRYATRDVFSLLPMFELPMRIWRADSSKIESIDFEKQETSVSYPENLKCLSVHKLSLAVSIICIKKSSYVLSGGQQVPLRWVITKSGSFSITSKSRFIRLLSQIVHSE